MRADLRDYSQWYHIQRSICNWHVITAKVGAELVEQFALASPRPSPGRAVGFMFFTKKSPPILKAGCCLGGQVVSDCPTLVLRSPSPTECSSVEKYFEMICWKVNSYL